MFLVLTIKLSEIETLLNPKGAFAASRDQLSN